VTCPVTQRPPDSPPDNQEFRRTSAYASTHPADICVSGRHLGERRRAPKLTYALPSGERRRTQPPRAPFRRPTAQCQHPVFDNAPIVPCWPMGRRARVGSADERCATPREARPRRGIRILFVPDRGQGGLKIARGRFTLPRVNFSRFFPQVPHLTNVNSWHGRACHCVRGIRSVTGSSGCCRLRLS
jgi:hypothetical protein